LNAICWILKHDWLDHSQNQHLENLEKIVKKVKMKHRSGHYPWIAAVLFCGMVPVSGAGWKTLPGHVPPVVSSLTAKGRLPATNQLNLAIGLPLRDVPGLDAFLAQLYDPASPNFRQFLTPGEFTARFGPTEQDYEAVKNFARTNGLAVTTTYSNRLVLDVAGPAAAVEQAFHVTLRTYRDPAAARDFYAPDTEPMVDAALPVVDVQGVSDFWRPRPRLHRMNTPAASAIANAGSAPDGSGSYFGNDFRNAYAPGTTLTGAGQAIGLFEADGFYSKDIAAYAAAAGNGRTNIAIQTVLLDGFSGVPTPGPYSGNPEVSLDIEMAIAMAPGLAKIVVYEGSPDNFVPNDILNAMLAGSATVKNLSCSWGWSGGPNTTTGSIFTNMAAVGQSFFNAAGDGDAFTTGAGSANGVDNPSLYNTPSSSPIITVVGGTTLTMNGSGSSYASETVWNWGYDAAAGGYIGSSGGISSYFSIPYWQTNINMTARGGSAKQRNIPDVALTADNVFVDYGNGSRAIFGGTSCAAPLWAGFTALANQQAEAGGTPVVGFINPAIYAIAAGSSYAACFHDVTTGNNTWSGSPNLFYATNGYDLCTGLGTPAGQNLINALAGSQAPASDALIVAPLSGAAAGVAGGPFSITSGSFLLTNASKSTLNWSLTSASAWLKISATNGTLAAAAQTNLTFSLTAVANSLAVGTYSANLVFSNWTSHAAQAGVFTLQVSQPLVVSPTNGFAASGPVGGAFNVTSQSCSLTNQSGSSLSWSTIITSSWLSASPSGGTLAGGAQTAVKVSLTAAANSLAAGVYAANLLVTNFAGVAASLPFTLRVGQSIVQNGGFETGDFTGWTLNASSLYNLVTASSGWVHSGSYGAAMGQSGSLGYLSQTLTTSPGQNYLLSLWVANPQTPYGATPNQFLVQWNGTTIFNRNNLPFTAWTNLQFMVAATSASTVLQIGFEDTPYYLGLDDVSATPVSSSLIKLAQKPAAKNADFNFTCGATAGLRYQVQYKTNLFQTNWINLGKPLVAATNTLTISDTNAFLCSPRRFYRLVIDRP
jgi:subtilase family serine protease